MQILLDKKGAGYYILWCRPGVPQRRGPPANRPDIPQGGDYMPAKKKAAKKKR